MKHKLTITLETSSLQSAAALQSALLNFMAASRKKRPSLTAAEEGETLSITAGAAEVLVLDTQIMRERSSRA